MKIHTLDTGMFKLDGGAMFGVVPKSIWNKLNPADENNMCTWALRCLLVEDGNRLILVDTGIGNKQDEKFFSHYYLHGDGSLDGALKAKGFSHQDVTDVFHTHLHFDHCGGTITRNEDGQLVSAFPKANLWTSARHFEWATHPNPRERASFLADNILPMRESGKLKFVEDYNNRPFGERMEIIYCDGHTERMMLPLFTEESGKKFLFCADLFPSSYHLGLPYVMGYDMRPLITMKEKEHVLKRAMREGTTLIFEHDPEIAAANLIQTEKGIRLGEPVTI